MTWEVLKCIIKVYIYARIKFNVGQNLVMHISEYDSHHHQFTLCGAQSQ
jgi:hypothetical protein